MDNDFFPIQCTVISFKLRRLFGRRLRTSCSFAGFYIFENSGLQNFICLHFEDSFGLASLDLVRRRIIVLFSHLYTFTISYRPWKILFRLYFGRLWIYSVTTSSSLLFKVATTQRKNSTVTFTISSKYFAIICHFVLNENVLPLNWSPARTFLFKQRPRSFFFRFSPNE